MNAMTVVAGTTAALFVATATTAAWSQKRMAPQKAGITGTWSGIVTQVGSTSPYSVIMSVKDQGGSTQYPELNCGGRLTLVGSSEGYSFYVETIVYGRLDKGGRCIDGSLTIAPAGKNLAWGWIGSHRGATLVAYSTLSR